MLCGSEEDDYNHYMDNQYIRIYEKNMTVPKLYRYYVPTTDGLSGWAEVVLSSGGFFAAVSDYGNYAFAWRHWGDGDFRRWFADMAVKSKDYFLGKISSSEFDLEETCKVIKAHIIQARRKENLSEIEAREEYDLVIGLALQEMGFEEWCRETSIVDAYDMRQDQYDCEAEAFADQVIPRVAELIRVELEKEELLKCST